LEAVSSSDKFKFFSKRQVSAQHINTVRERNVVLTRTSGHRMTSVIRGKHVIREKGTSINAASGNEYPISQQIN